MSKTLFVLAILAAVAVGAYFYIHRHPGPPDIAFGADGVDFAQLEAKIPLSPVDLDRVTPDSLKSLTQEQVDQLYARLTAGPIPDAPFDGDLFFPRGSDRSRFAEVVGGGIAGGLKGGAAEIQVAKLEFLGAQLWKGKVFDREDRLLRNRISDLKSLDLLLTKDEEAQLETLRSKELGQYLLFPARLYCGQSLLDGRRESIIIDYAYTDQLPGYLAKLDRLVGREGLAIRDEIRMVRPGFYLGRAYLNRVFGVNFTLYNKELAEAGRADFLASGRVAEDCWTGEQKRHADAT